MGFWSTVAQIGGDYVGGGAGTAIANAGKVADAVAPLIQHSGQTSAQNQQLRYAQNLEAGQSQTDRDRLALAAQIAEQNGQASAASAAVEKQKEMDAQRTAAAKAAVQGALLKNMQDVTFDRSQFHTNVPNVSFQGGSRPSALGAEGRLAGSTLNASGQHSLENPTQLPDVPMPTKYQQTEPKVPAPPEETIWEKMAGPLGLGLTLFGQAAKGATSATPTVTPNAPSGNRVGDVAGASGLSGGDLEQLMQIIEARRGQNMQQQNPNLGRNVDFGTGVIPQPTPAPGFGGITFAPPTSGGG